MAVSSDRTPADFLSALSPEDAPLFEALREWRRKAADEAAMPPYIVFSDRTLVAIAQVRPSTPSELLSISGVGAKKLEEWGSAVLDVVATAS